MSILEYLQFPAVVLFVDIQKLLNLFLGRHHLCLILSVLLILLQGFTLVVQLDSLYLHVLY